MIPVIGLVDIYILTISPLIREQAKTSHQNVLLHSDVNVIISSNSTFAISVFINRDLQAIIVYKQITAIHATKMANLGSKF